MTGIWPGDTRCVVMLGFDIDGVSSAINRDPASAHLPSLMSAREYGPSVATPRILDLLERYGIPASFYIPGYVAETHEELVREIVERGARGRAPRLHARASGDAHQGRGG